MCVSFVFSTTFVCLTFLNYIIHSCGLNSALAPSLAVLQSMALDTTLIRQSLLRNLADLLARVRKFQERQRDVQTTVRNSSTLPAFGLM